MSWRSYGLLGLAIAWPALSSGQTRPRLVTQVHVLGTSASPGLLGGGLGVGYRASGRWGVLTTLTAGRKVGTTGRVEALATYHLDHRRRTGWGPYVAGGVAFEISPNAEYLVIQAGVESRPARRSGWFVEVGAGGGLKAAAGFRVRPGPGP